jgi:lipopolysaccharide transport system ATP-binding protein
MYVRLAFAVAAHLEPEILIVDEVLAVGDAEFQKKALGKMKDVSEKDHRTVLFVSHNMAAISQLCSRCISMHNGTILEMGNADKVISNYLSRSGVSEPHINLKDVTLNRVGNKKVEFVEIYLTKPSQPDVTRLFSTGDSISIHFTMKIQKPNQKAIKTSIEVKSSEGLRIANMIDIDSSFQVKYDNEELISYEVTLHDLRFYPDTYYLSLYAGDMSSTEAYDYIEDCISFDIVDGGGLTTRTLPRAAGLLFLTPEWKKSN